MIPAWISKRLGIKAFLSAEQAVVTGAVPRRKQPISFANYRARVFCGSCNSHFKHLEDAVIPLLVPMARERTLALDADSQALLAMWAHKTAVALVAAAGLPRDLVPDEHRTAIRRQGAPGTRCRVDFFSWHGEPVLGAGQAEAASSRVAQAVANGYAAFLAFGHVGFRVIAVDGGIGPSRELPPLQQFWPPVVNRQLWPPPTTDNMIILNLLRW